MPQSQGHLLSEKEVASLFDGMADEYDAISDLWYSWVFCRLHYFLLVDLARSGLSPGGRCLDVGCGTGFQSLLLNLCGHDAVGIDVAGVLLEKAKLKRSEDYLTRDFFDAPFPFARKYSVQVRELTARYRRNAPIGKSEYRVATAVELPFADASFEVVNCCGSTLSFVEDYLKAMREMARVLKPGGLLFLEIENKYTPDLLWSFLDAKILGGRMGYDGIARDLFSDRLENTTIDYPFSTKEGEVTMPIWLFSSGRFLRELRGLGFVVSEIRSVHSVTNLIPSVYLDSARPSRKLVGAFRALSSVEEIVAAWPIVRRLGCSLVLTARKP